MSNKEYLIISLISFFVFVFEFFYIRYYIKWRKRINNNNRLNETDRMDLANSYAILVISLLASIIFLLRACEKM